MQEIRERRTVTIIPAGTLSPVLVKKWLKNLLKFTAPFLAVFFGQLALGVNWKVAGLVALAALYGALADLFNKISNEQILP